MNTSLNCAHDQLLFTPGPLTTSLSVKQAMLRDLGSWHGEFIGVVEAIRNGLLKTAGLSRENGWCSVLMQGSGTFGVESVFQSCISKTGKVAVLANGAYGERMAQILSHAGIEHVVLTAAENNPVSVDELENCLSEDASITHVAVVHCETTTGMVNPIEKLGAAVRRHGKVFIVDAMSSFGGIPIDVEGCGIDYLVSSSNKCIEGVPGVSFVICRQSHLMECAGFSRSLSLDLVGQMLAFEKDAKFRFTPPTHVLLAFHQALKELESEGGVEGRSIRYRANHRVLQEGMKRLGFDAYLSPENQGPIITAYHYPSAFEFEFKLFYEMLAQRGFVIYPGKLTRAETFRIGNIGRLFEADIRSLLLAIREVLQEMGVNISPNAETFHALLD